MPKPALRETGLATAAPFNGQSRFALKGALLCALLALAGCAGYQAGLDATRGQSIYVAPVQNDTDFPELSGQATAAIRSALAAGGGWTLASAGQADTILHTRIVGFERGVAAVQSDDVGRGQKYELVFQALVTFQPADASQPPFFVDRMVTARRDVFAGESLVDAERQAGPTVANELGLRIAQAASDTW